MRKTLLAAAIATATMMAAAPAMAAEGCGAGFHRIADGTCVVNRVGIFYHGLGWWDGQRFWHARYRHHGIWRYR